MKSTILNLKERVLVVETPEGTVRTEIMNNGNNTQTILLHLYDERGCFQSLPISEPGILEEICKGSELSEEIAKKFFHNKESFSSISDYVDDVLLTYKEKFISAIEATNFWWEKNPVQKPLANVLNLNYQQKCDFKNRMERFNYNESRTFHPKQCLLFKIV